MTLTVVVERVQRVGLTACSGDGNVEREDLVAVEEPLEIRVDGSAFVVIMRTPGHDLELAAGFLLAESILERPEDLATLTNCPDAEFEENVVEARLRPELGPARMGQHKERATFVSSSCGVCGRRTLEAAASRAPAFPGEAPRYTRGFITELPIRLREHQELFSLTGGLHGVGLFSSDGEALVVREDVGRHNAVDKCIGARFLSEEWPVTESVLVVSGRASFEIVDKALIAGVRTVVAVSAPSSLAVELARSANMNLFGFVRGESLNVYVGELE